MRRRLTQLELVGALLGLLEVAKVPFAKERASDETTHVQQLPLFLNALAPLLRMGGAGAGGPVVVNESFEATTTGAGVGVGVGVGAFDPDVVAGAAANVVTEFASDGVRAVKEREPNEEDKLIYGYESSPVLRLHEQGNRNLRAVAKSDVPNALISFLAAKENSQEALIAAIEAVGHCALYRPVAVKFSQLGLLKDLVLTIGEVPDFRSYLVRISMEAIWNIVEVAGDRATETMAVEEVVFALRRVFERVLRQGYKLDDKHLRNELLVLVNYCAMNLESHAYFLASERGTAGPGAGAGAGAKQSFYELLLYYATYDELNSAKVKFVGAGTSKSIKPLFTTKEEDLEFKKVLWLSVFFIARNAEQAEGAALLVQKEFLEALLIYLDPGQSNAAMHNWQSPQLKDLQVQAMMTLRNCVPFVMEHFFQISGHLTLIQFMSFYQDQERRLSCLKALLVTSREPEMKQDFAEKGLTQVLLELVANDAENGLEMREIAFNIISNICTDSRANQKEFRRKGGIELLRANLKLEQLVQNASFHREAGTLGGNSVATYLVGALDCLSNAVLVNKRSELHFLDVEGVNVLLDLLEECEPSLQRLLVSCLCSLMENPKAINYFVEWNSEKTAISATELLLRLYQAEDARHGVRYRDGVLTDLERPLNPTTSFAKRKAQAQQAAAKDDDEFLTYAMASTQDAWKNRATTTHTHTTTLSASPDHSVLSGGGYATTLNKHSLQPRGESKGSQRAGAGASRGGSRDAAQALKMKQKAEVVQRLMGKIDKARRDKDLYSESYFNQKLVECAHLHDLRGSIFALFIRVGYDLHEIGATDQQTMQMVQLYPHMLSGEIWRDVKEDLHDQVGALCSSRRRT